MPNATIVKFGYPDSLLREYEHWVVLLRPDQPTVGSMVLACKEDAESLGTISPEAGAELPMVAGHLDVALSAAFGHDKINYLALMMVDPHVHFHVIPRYEGAVRVGSSEHRDAGWPAHPRLTEVLDLAADGRAEIAQRLIDAWPT